MLVVRSPRVSPFSYETFLLRIIIWYIYIYINVISDPENGHCYSNANTVNTFTISIYIYNMYIHDARVVFVEKSHEKNPFDSKNNGIFFPLFFFSLFSSCMCLLCVFLSRVFNSAAKTDITIIINFCRFAAAAPGWAEYNTRIYCAYHLYYFIVSPSFDGFLSFDLFREFSRSRKQGRGDCSRGGV